jgi:hypothetical protein
MSKYEDITIEFIEWLLNKTQDYPYKPDDLLLEKYYDKDYVFTDQEKETLSLVHAVFNSIIEKIR